MHIHTLKHKKLLDIATALAAVAALVVETMVATTKNN